MAMNMNEMLKKAKRLQEEASLQETEIQKKEFKVTKQGIEAVLLGSRKIKSLKINPALIDPEDPELVEDLVVLTINEGLALIEEEYEELNDKFSGLGF
ncbi:YbaB/EbfC family nucleoid-associated protein [Metamycoplasma hyosynoviae]|uniref:Nucleoid-associated protein QJ129_01565 n=1 Tax=Metamycoplasma hyosynoviae TaxID=29559 RepID=A0AAP4EKF9_9BACT|nr:YbaB/EbfC family nucleoid-associated protein [Metamycoplasma hyosynoviae]MDC8937967.1 YbaB/EbfC family nucleoid-associated protein [Metamycoplasma hyosynoviae]MDD7837697.1 YbaB/EbfC family nucleoid-associated protein [Metamycoplasma hyosynoviae]MDI3047946.1 YbaB/EbfC family nucleoid-associated protein [Metamycoplasma hyosynoviae]MDI3102964.1 YbaB/EbfC family nucleoid-associated protein [Metamycoplasma hyosynoviae]MDI3118043.1 YbaB/EbfC family nucleoid-associated protein [Metamycoplasma hyos